MALTPEDIVNAELDIETIGAFVNGGVEDDVTNRAGDTFPSMRKASSNVAVEELASVAGQAAADAALGGKADVNAGNIDDETWRTALGVGYGNTPGTVAAGNDIRLSAMPRNNIVALFGDSIMAQGVNNATNVLSTNNRGMTSWVPALTRQNYLSPQSVNFGIIGNTTADMLARIQDVIDSGAGICVVMGGTNDDTATPNTTKNNLDQIYKRLALANILTIAVPILPRTTSVAAEYGARHSINRWIKQGESRYPNFHCTLPYLFGDPYSLTSSPRSGFTYDGLHPTAIGMRYVAKYVADYLNTLSVKPTSATPWVTDFYAAATNPTGYVNANALLAGSAGTANTGVTGSVANNYAISFVANGGSQGAMTITASKPTNVETGLECQRIVLVGSASGGYRTLVAFDHYNFSNNSDGALKAGDNVMVEADIEVIGGTSGISSIAAYLTTTEGGVLKTTIDGVDVDSAGSYASDDLTLDGYTAVLRSPVRTLTADNTLASCGIYITLRNTSSTVRALTLEIKSISVRKVIP